MVRYAQKNQRGERHQKADTKQWPDRLHIILKARLFVFLCLFLLKNIRLSFLLKNNHLIRYSYKEFACPGLIPHHFLIIWPKTLSFLNWE